jgi:chorismate mutase
MGINITTDLEPFLKGKAPLEKTLLIAGPCSIESEEQVMQTALELGKINKVHLLRGGVWKPRTRPGSFEGIGEKALPWLKNAGAAIGVPVTVEVATPEHAEQSLKAGIDVLWIGARTTVNPFAVQAIADAVKGVSIPIMIKNPINPDIELWIGAFERLYKAGITQLMAIHRGFSSHRKTEYRNAPYWRIPIDLKQIFKGIPLICDPSHLCGNTTLIQAVSQEALDFLYDGLMIEVHINPSVALSDAKQQLTPQQYGELIDNLKVKKQYTDSKDYRMRITFMRHEIDDIDDNIIQLLGRRMSIVKEIGAFKKNNDVSSFQPERFKEILQSRAKAAAEKNISKDFIVQIYELIHEEALRQQEENGV